MNKKHLFLQERNRLQNLFLSTDNCNHILRKIFNKKTNTQISEGEVIFEGIFKWDLIFEGFQYWSCDCDWTVKSLDDDCDCQAYKKFKEKIPENCSDPYFNTLYCEIRPILDDEYPAVLRKMKTQIELTNDTIRKENDKIKGEYARDRKCYKTEEEFKYALKQKLNSPTFVLIVKELRSNATTKEQLVSIFKKDSIQIVFIDDVIETEKGQSVMVEELDIVDENLKKQVRVLREENKVLRKKVKELEEENECLKNKSIKQYFDKK